MASLSTGSVNFPSIVYENSAQLVGDLATKMQTYGIRPEIEIFDLSHIHAARRLVDDGLMDDHPHVQFVLGIKNALPAEEHLLDMLLGELKRQARVMDWILARNADGVRTGLEDNIRVTRDRLAKSNAELVAIAADKISKHNRRHARPEEARNLLLLRTTH
jgi:3-keto-5-aminohexanoate cleavage enzyme